MIQQVTEPEQISVRLKYRNSNRVVPVSECGGIRRCVLDPTLDNAGAGAALGSQGYRSKARSQDRYCNHHTKIRAQIGALGVGCGAGPVGPGAGSGTQRRIVPVLRSRYQSVQYTSYLNFNRS